ncbi:methyl-accepting chemotaxis protein [Labilibacter marinus]|uniref:methyl-accepting chemotaxis protein n=1 Tax=Labilibacter marinus TaxID=1477105 RepID=UPI000829B802|nr:methyl-accepting chemotaxis protein [Labilibacter marinus]
MEDFLVFFVVMSLMLPVGYFALKIVFKKSIIFSLSWLNLLIVYFSSLIYFAVGSFGLIHLFWGLPVVSAITGGFYLRIKSKVQQPLLQTVDQLGKIADGDLQIGNVKDIDHQNNELGLLTGNIQKLVLVLKHLVKEINKSSKKLSKSSVLLANNTRSLANDTSKQAASSKKLESTMGDIANRVGENAHNASQSNELSQKNMGRLQELFSLSKDLIIMVDEISSKTIEIDDIAKGTNILALNAAIEAVKSGASGKGFTVVATEIRKLAERSKETAEQITDLSANSKKLVGKTGELFEDMLPQMENNFNMVAEICDASSDQKVSVEEVNYSLKELNQINDNNVSISEDIAFTTEQLKDLSNRLKESLHFFKVDETSTKERMKKAKNKQQKKTPVMQEGNSKVQTSPEGSLV